MSVDWKNWQTTRPTIRERSKFMFNNDLFSDVKFVVERADDKSGSKQVIPAHKFMLSISSPVFQAMFYGELAETTDSIELPDCEYDSLLEMLRYMYSDEVILSGSNVMGVLYLAKKYMVPSLADECTQYLQGHLDSSNVFSILPSAQKFEDTKLVDRCWTVIDEETSEAVKSDGFWTIERSLLEVVVERDTLTIKEIELFKAVDLWATKECERQGLAADGEVKRKILGEDLIKRIRFPTMKQEDFASVVLDSEILTPKEIVSIVKYLSSVPRSPVGFPETKRCGFACVVDTQRCCRFGSLSNSPCRMYYDPFHDVINFFVDKDIVLHGLRLFGSESNTYSVEMKIMKAPSGKILVSKVGQFASRLLECEIGSYYGFEVLFDRHVILKKNTTYEMWAKIRGPESLNGGNGASSVKCREVTFTFIKNPHLAVDFNATDLHKGQFPELLFALK